MFEFYLAQEYWFAAAQLSLAMLGMGATLTLKDFGAIVTTPRAFTVGMTLQLILVPLIAFLFILMSGATTGVLIGLALLAAIPGGTVSNIFTYLGKGNIVLSITLFLLIPLIIGMVIYSKLPNHADKISKVGIYGSIFVILLIVIGSAGAGRLDLARFGIANVLVILTFALTLMCLSILIPRLSRVGAKDGTAIQIEVTVLCCSTVRLC